MATVVDEFVTTLRLDASDFTKGQVAVRESLQRTRSESTTVAKSLEADGARAAQFFAQVKTEALSLIGVLLGAKGIEAFGRQATKSLADIGREAKNIGLSVPELAAFRNMIERNGGSAEAATSSLKGYADQVERFKVFGDATVLQYLNPIGADINDSPIAVFQKFMKFVQDNKDKAGGIQLINLEGKGLGFDQGLINAAIQMGTVAKANAELGRSYELGVPTQEQIDKVTAMQHSLTGLGQAAQQAGNNLLSDMAPGITAVSDALSDWIAKHPKESEEILAVATALTTLGAVRMSASLMGLTGVVTTIDTLLGLLPRLAPLLLTGPAGGEDPDFSKQKNEEFLRNNPPGSDPLSTWWRNHMPHWMGGGGQPPIADQSMAPEQQQFLQSLSGPESGGDYKIKNGGSHFEDTSRFPEGVGPGGTSTASGRYQFTTGTWAEVSSKLGLKDFSPVSQDRAAWYLAAREYQQKTGRDLQSDLKAGGHESNIALALNGRWPSLPGGSQYRGAPNGVPKPGPTFGPQAAPEAQNGSSPPTARPQLAPIQDSAPDRGSR
ncbi:MAG: hypothetical protein P4L90_26120, partial [Rhodopila sp.]|nr:hypothetical protein [Rhodopila sp.]